MACSLLKSFDGFEGRVAELEAGPSPVEASAPDAGGCSTARWPGPPPASTEAPDEGEVVSALSDLQVLNETGTVRGFDIDGLCTCPEVPACRGSEGSCDADGGVDNAAASFFEQFAAAGQSIVDDEGLRAGSRRGWYSVILRVVGYNGRPDDPSVTVSVLNGYELSSGGDAGAPLFDGTDEWRIDEGSFPRGQIALYSSSRAWVTNNVLVAEIPALVVKLRVPSQSGKQLVTLEFREVRLVAKLMPSGSSFALDEGTLAGRWSAAAVLKELQRNKVCADDPIYPTVRTILCKSLDVPLSTSDDGRDGRCRALSFGFGFTSLPARIGPIGTPVDPEKCALVDDDCED